MKAIISTPLGNSEVMKIAILPTLQNYDLIEEIVFNTLLTFRPMETNEMQNFRL